MNNTTRFSNRVEDYVKYRPTYPKEIISFLQERYGLSIDKTIADIGAGTGISTTLFLHAGYAVFAVEPNEAMRNKAIELLGKEARFAAVAGTAEHSNLAPQSIDAIVVGQAFHWFDMQLSKVEFKRVLKENGLLILIWNERQTTSDFEKKYDQLIVDHGIDYVKVDHRNIGDEDIQRFFDPNDVELKIFPNQQVFDFTGLKGRLLSSSYMPKEDDPGYPLMIEALQKLFDQHQQAGTITIHYDTKVYVGRLG